MSNGFAVLLRIRPSLQSRPVVIVGVRVRPLRLSLLLLFGPRAQAWLSGGVILDLPCEHDVAQASLHAIKFRGGNDVFRPIGQNACNLFLRVFDALWRRRWVSKEV